MRDTHWILAAGAAGLGGYAVHRYLRNGERSTVEVARVAATARRLGELATAARRAPEARRADPGALITAPPPRTGRALSRAFDPIFEAEGQGLPIPYLRALAARESSMDPRNVTQAARGLMQIIPVVRRDYNRRHGASITPDELFDPRISVRICADLLRLIVADWARRHPDVPAMRQDWDEPAFVTMLTYGWTAGWSAAPRGGVGHVVGYLKARGVPPDTITARTVHERAAEARASRHLSHPNKLPWAESVTRLYLAERARDEDRAEPVSRPS